MSDEEQIVPTLPPEGPIVPTEHSGAESEGNLSESNVAQKPPSLEQVDDQPAERIGEVALSEDEKFADPYHNKDLAHEMAVAQDPLEQIAINLQKSDLRNKDELIKDIQEKGEQAAQVAHEKYIKEEDKYAVVRDTAVGELIHASANSDVDYATLVEFFPSYGSYRVDKDDASTEFSPALMTRLRKELSNISGSNLDSVADIQEIEWHNLPVGKHGWRTKSSPTNLEEGLLLTENHIIDDGQTTQVRLCVERPKE